MNRQVVVYNEGRTGLTMGSHDEQVVTFLKKRPEPLTIVEVIRSDNNGTGVLEWKYVKGLTVAEQVEWSAEELPAGLVGGIDPSALTPEQQSELKKTFRKAVGVHFVEEQRIPEFITHFMFANPDDERSWVAKQLAQGCTFKLYDGKPVLLSDGLRNLIASQFMGMNDLLSDRSKEYRDEINELSIKFEIQKQNLQRATIATTEAEAKAEDARSAAQRATASISAELEEKQREDEEIKEHLEIVGAEISTAEAKKEELDKVLANLEKNLEEKKKALEEQIRPLQELYHEKKAKLDESINELSLKRDQLKLEVKRLERRAEGHDDWDESQFQSVVELFNLEKISDEQKALTKLWTQLGERVDFTTLVAVHTALKHFPFLVLTGPSGSGKSSLLRLYSKGLGILSQLIPVQQNWTSSADLHGYVSPIGEKHFITTRFSNLLGSQFSDGNELYSDVGVEPPFLSLAILDEINLAHVEYYLADYLSALESDSREVELALRQEIKNAVAPVWLQAGQGKVKLPPSFLIAGTANEDHTTRGFSDKFRDRAAVLEIPPNGKGRVGKLFNARRNDTLVPVGRVTPAVWNDWKTTPQPGSEVAQTQAFDRADKVINAFFQNGIDLGHRIIRDVELFIRAAEPLLKPKFRDDDQLAKEVCDVALAMRVMQKCMPLMDKKFDHRTDKRDKCIVELKKIVPEDLKRTRAFLSTK